MREHADLTAMVSVMCEHIREHGGSCGAEAGLHSLCEERETNAESWFRRVAGEPQEAESGTILVTLLSSTTMWAAPIRR